MAGHSHGVLWDEVHQGAQCVLPQLLKAEPQQSSLRAARGEVGQQGIALSSWLRYSLAETAQVITAQLKDMFMFSALLPLKKIQVEEMLGRFLFSSESRRQMVPSIVCPL